MLDFNPLLLVGGVIGVFSLIFIIAYLSIKDKKTAIGFDRNMKDAEIVRHYRQDRRRTAERRYEIYKAGLTVFERL